MTAPSDLEQAKQDAAGYMELAHKLRAENEALKLRAWTVVHAFRAYRERGVMPAPTQYQAVVDAIAALGAALARRTDGL